MAARKHRLENKCIPDALSPAAAIEWRPLPVDLLLEIVAHSDARTLVRCAAISKLLRRCILGPSFIHRVTRQGCIVPPYILAYLNTHDDEADPPLPLLLVHPTTAAAASFLDGHMSPYMSRFADDLLGEYISMTSRGGLILLYHRDVRKKLSNLCLYDFFTGHRTFFSNPDIGSNSTRCYYLLTSADGIGCSFMLFVANLGCKPGNNGKIIEVRTLASLCGSWARSFIFHESSTLLKRAMHRDAAVLHGGVMHWLVRHRGEIVTYNVCTMEQGTILLPALITNFKGRFYLGSYYSHAGRKLLRLLAYKGLMIYVWHQLPGGHLGLEVVTIDMEKKLRSLCPSMNYSQSLCMELEWPGEGSNMMVLRIYRHGSSTSRGALYIVLDIETKEIHVHQKSSPSSSLLLEIDLPSRLRAMKLFA